MTMLLSRVPMSDVPKTLLYRSCRRTTPVIMVLDVDQAEADLAAGALA